MTETISNKSQTTHFLWAANPHEYGPGKIHLVDPDDVPSQKTFCGKRLEAIPGTLTRSGKPTCKICLNSVVTRQERKIQRQIWEREYENRKAAEDELLRLQRQQYHSYLQTSAWRAKSQLVIKRAGGICEGCGIAPARQAHHLTYQHITQEFLWELKAVCIPCHERFHDKQQDKIT